MIQKKISITPGNMHPPGIKCKRNITLGYQAKNHNSKVLCKSTHDIRVPAHGSPKMQQGIVKQINPNRKVSQIWQSWRGTNKALNPSFQSPIVHEHVNRVRVLRQWSYSSRCRCLNYIQILCTCAAWFLKCVEDSSLVSQSGWGHSGLSIQFQSFK